MSLRIPHETSSSNPSLTHVDGKDPVESSCSHTSVVARHVIRTTAVARSSLKRSSRPFEAKSEHKISLKRPCSPSRSQGGPLSRSPHSPSPRSPSDRGANSPVGTPPVSPERKTQYISVPPTPHRRKTRRPKLPFSIASRAPLDERPDTVRNWTRLLDPERQCCRILDVQGVYELEKSLLCVKQPPQKQSCAAGASLMLLSHLIPENPRLLKDGFWKWYSEVCLANTKEVITTLSSQTDLSSLNLEVKGIYFNNPGSVNWLINNEKPFKGYSYEAIERRDLSFIRHLDHLQNANGKFPLIVSVTNPEIAGHWIVIDRFDHAQERAYLRDPFTGRAYAIPYAELYQNWPEDDEVKVIYLSPNPKPTTGG